MLPLQYHFRCTRQNMAVKAQNRDAFWDRSSVAVTSSTVPGMLLRLVRLVSVLYRPRIEGGPGVVGGIGGEVCQRSVACSTWSESSPHRTPGSQTQPPPLPVLISIVPASGRVTATTRHELKILNSRRYYTTKIPRYGVNRRRRTSGRATLRFLISNS